MHEYYMLYKPCGCITARRDARHRTVMDYLPEEKREVIFPVGRLDEDTEGLLVLTDDGALCASLLNPTSHVEKTYFFYALGDLSEDVRVEVLGQTALKDVKNLLCGKDIKLANRRPDTPVIFGNVTVTEGKKHQVRRMLMYAGCRIVYLKRISMGALSLDEALSPGEYRPLSPDEINALTASSIGNSQA